jgi:hypothetical protein
MTVDSGRSGVRAVRRLAGAYHLHIVATDDDDASTWDTFL